MNACIHDIILVCVTNNRNRFVYGVDCMDKLHYE
jgi:hypothetical protein